MSIQRQDNFAYYLDIRFNQSLDLKNRKIRLSGEISSELFDHLDSCMNQLESMNSQPITIVISSPGGDPYSALSICGRLRASNCQIITEGYGYIMSAAVLILACGDERRISRYSWFMTHKASYGIHGKHDDIVEEVKNMEQQERWWAKWLAEFSKKSESFWLEAVKNKNMYVTADECLKYGIVDKII